MKVALIAPSNLLYMPYIDNYTSILDDIKRDYDIINWDRFGIEEKKKLTYRDSKEGHQRGLFDYLLYHKFIMKQLRDNKYDKVIVFGIQLTFFLKRCLLRNYKKNYIIDIRDYNKVFRYSKMESVISNSFMTVISSPKYKDWLPQNNKYVVNHNLNINSIENIKESVMLKKGKYSISYIGSLANFNENRDLINAMKNSSRFDLNFYGEGLINEKLNRLKDAHKINNVNISGRYEKRDEVDLYLNSDIINMILYNKNINDKTCLSNRLYKSAIYGKPMIACKGTYISEVIGRYKLGLVLDSLIDVETELENYILNFDIKEYENGRVQFLRKVIEENFNFRDKLQCFTI